MGRGHLEQGDNHMKYAIITGASRGIGLATAKRFLQEGYQVINLARTPCPLPEVKNIKIDLSVSLVPDTQTRLQHSLTDLLVKPIDTIALIHNAGMVHKDRAHQGSSIIYLGSTLSYKGVSDYFSYIVSKHGVLGMMRASAQDLKPFGIHS